MRSPLPNRAPETRISSEAPQPHQPASYQVHLSWIGEDEDGLVAGYYYAWDDTLDGEGNPAWRYTTAGESTFVVSADSCPRPPCEGRRAPFFDYHTFWVKAVDDGGGHDPTPASRTFTATTVAPEAWITVGPPTICVGCLQSPEDVYMAWEAEDPDGRVVGYWYKWGMGLYGQHPFSRGPDPTASGWIFVPAETTSVSSHQVAGSRGCRDGGNEFAVFAVDDAGAVQQITRCSWGDRRGNWVCFCPDPESEPTGLCIDGGPLGIRCTSGHYCDVSTGERGDFDPSAYGLGVVGSVFYGTELRFRWRTLLGRYGIPIPHVGYRYAVDDPEAWRGRFQEETTQFPPDGEAPWLPPAGSHVLYVESRDRSGRTVGASFPFMVVLGPGQSDPPIPPRILLVDDTGSRDGCYSEWRQFQDEQEDEFWERALAGFPHDAWDAWSEFDAPGPLVLSHYTTVIWCVNSGGWDGPFLQRRLFGTRADYVSSYIAAGGNFLFTGMNPVFALMVLCPRTGLLGDACCAAPTKGPWLIFDPALCSDPVEGGWPPFLLTRFGVRAMKVPVAPASDPAHETDRVTVGCIPTDTTGIFNRYLRVDSLKAGGPIDNPPHGSNVIHRVPCANVTDAGGLESWVTPIYTLDGPFPLIERGLVIGIMARGDQNPRRPPGGTDWGDAVFLGTYPFFLKDEDAAWFVQTVAAEVFGERPNPAKPASRAGR